ncbi:MAG: hypothetical protein CMJ98_04605 [Planctomycetes bacterium]|nr:hypothetical protein [Planctomycetota bacterium]MDP6384977.1 hypothetical protein [Planctomycetota bacterium]MDP6738646.1 hypothetical protein [Planctomycetota bacterium]MDP6939399.1 hypothetical protein [Planctomycetota bacterium]HJM56264.1 hypothetical protein [Planctomycetota bacterium]
MSTSAIGLQPQAGDLRPRAGDVMCITFLGVVAMLFAGFTAAYFIRRPSPDWVPITIPAWGWIGTGALVVSSTLLERSRRRQDRGLLWASILLGVLFLGTQLLSWRELSAAGVYLPSTPHGSFYFMLSAVHGVHLFGGLLALIYTATRRSEIRWVAGYWHFMGLTWLYTLLLLAN